MYLLDQQGLFILYLMWEDLNQIKRIALHYRQEGYNIFRLNEFEEFALLRGDHKQKKMMLNLSATIIKLMMQIQPVLELFR